MKIGKNGEELTLWVFIEILAAIFVGYMLVNVATAYAQGTIYEKLNIAKDIALQIDAIKGLPGDIYIVNTNLHGYSLYFHDHTIEVYEEGNDQITGIYYFAADLGIDKRFIRPKQLIISKMDDIITISEIDPRLS